MPASTKSMMTACAAVALLAAVLSGCGGGGSGGPVAGEGDMPSVDGDGDGMMPDDADTAMPIIELRAFSRAYSRDNPTAEDLLDHWNAPQTLRTAVGLSAVGQSGIAERKSHLKALLDGAVGNPENAGAGFRNVGADDVEIIGEKNGITYGQWKGGPAGTLNIEIDWRFSSIDDPLLQALAERAGKSWSRRLLDEFGTHVVPAGTTVQHFVDRARTQLVTGTFHEDVATNGILIAWFDSPLPGGYGSPEMFDSTDSDFEPWLGVIAIENFSVNYPAQWRFHLIAHEIGHVLGFTNTAADYGFPSSERYVNRRNYTFEGPQSTRANDGNPVPFQWLDENFNWVPPRSQGATVDYGHLGVCSSIMSYCLDVTKPSEIDFAFLADIGYDVLDAATASEPEVYGWGAWGRYSAWGVGVQRTLRLDSSVASFEAFDQLGARVDAFGMAPSTSLTDNRFLKDTATWSGSLLGVDLGYPMLPPVFGDAELQVNLSNLAGAARFSDLTVYVENQPAPFRASSLEYSIDVTGNSFSDADDRVNGGFFGPAHEEMAGILDDRSSNVNLLAGFGGRR